MQDVRTQLLFVSHTPVGCIPDITRYTTNDSNRMALQRPPTPSPEWEAEAVRSGESGGPSTILNGDHLAPIPRLRDRKIVQMYYSFKYCGTVRTQTLNPPVTVIYEASRHFKTGFIIIVHFLFPFPKTRFCSPNLHLHINCRLIVYTMAMTRLSKRSLLASLVPLAILLSMGSLSVSHPKALRTSTHYVSLYRRHLLQTQSASATSVIATTNFNLYGVSL